MFKVLCVEEGVMEMAVESKWRFFGENGKSQQAQGPQASVLRTVPPMDDTHIDLRSENHMLLPYQPYQKHVHPRANSQPATFVVEGSTIHYLPSPQEFEPDTESTVEYHQDSRQTLYFKLDETGQADRNSLWFCTSLQSGKSGQLLRCEEVGTNVIEDIPVQRLCFAMRKSDEKCISPYDKESFISSTSSSATMAKSKASQKKGKMDANTHSAYSITSHL
jgi:hypothetical protein